MRFIVFVKATAESESGAMPDEQVLNAMARLNEQMQQAGVLLAGEGLKPTKHGTRIHLEAGKRTLTDGPFTETKELVAGFWMLQTRTREEALAWLARVPDPGPGKTFDMELRPLFEAEDFDYAPGITEREHALREKLDER